MINAHFKHQPLVVTIIASLALSCPLALADEALVSLIQHGSLKTQEQEQAEQAVTERAGRTPGQALKTERQRLINDAYALNSMMDKYKNDPSRKRIRFNEASHSHKLS